MEKRTLQKFLVSFPCQPPVFQIRLEPGSGTEKFFRSESRQKAFVEERAANIIKMHGVFAVVSLIRTSSNDIGSTGPKRFNPPSPPPPEEGGGDEFDHGCRVFFSCTIHNSAKDYLSNNIFFTCVNESFPPPFPFANIRTIYTPLETSLPPSSFPIQTVRWYPAA